jgi:poly(A) polymerase
LPLREILALQPRFERREGKRALRLLENTRFRAAYDFLLLRAAAGAVDPELAEWWTDIQSLPPEERLAKFDSQARPASSANRSRRRRRRRRPSAP